MRWKYCDNVMMSQSHSIEFKIIKFEKNQGHGMARSAALRFASNKLVALMDADDVSLKDRFEKQLRRFMDKPGLSVVGGQISEFEDSPDHVIGIRRVPLQNSDIIKYSKKRCPMNQMSVMLCRDEVEKVGGYQDWYCNEDYYLWLRMLEAKCQFENLPDILVNVRVGEEMASRRGGWQYFLSEIQLQVYMYKKGMISLLRWLFNVFIRFGGEVLLNSRMRNKAYKFMRDRETKGTTDVESVKNEHECTERYATYPKFSVAMCVYGKDKPEWFDAALNSVIDQTVKPSEIVLVVDGPIPESIQAVIDKYRDVCAKGGGVTLRIIRFLQNKGLGEALRVAIEKCRYELIARMDSDDIAVANRFATQLMYFRSDDIDVCGGQIEEFLDSPSHVIGKRIVPLTDSGIKTYMKKRCPFNHMTVMYKKSAVLEAGNYQDWFWNEDYYLWIRMYLAGMKFGNVPETLVLVRTGEDMYSRRGGRRYFHSEIGLQKLMLKEKMITPLIYFGNCTKRFVLQLFLPNSVRGWVFKTFARSRRDIEY